MKKKLEIIEEFYYKVYKTKTNFKAFMYNVNTYMFVLWMEIQCKALNSYISVCVCVCECVCVCVFWDGLFVNHWIIFAAALNHCFHNLFLWQREDGRIRAKHSPINLPHERLCDQ